MMIQEELRNQTASPHQQLEKLVVARLKPIRSNAEYADLLKIFYSYFKNLEEAIAPYITKNILADYPERRHAVSLAEDIVELGGDLNDLTEVPVPFIDSTAKALGALYVMEGSVMGGMVIVRMLAKYGITEGVSFFSGYGSETGQKWNAFIDALGANISEEHAADAIYAARDTFARFADAFQI
ncbi:biliverdin-producing heme oxygenase [Sphingobacterium sp. HMA12]|uniref:biliverdin-producing heme oxygenase n=1 Tax=Sphingobacterium sp. HMA12 TaxID=2050894 RepID=UPI001F32EF12|nr:biliverdin-producing heme oxygenase [Sphingobacterium sp. HMA12]